MYDYIIGILEEAQAIWPLASSWLIGLKSWMRGPDTGRVYEGVFMADGVRLLYAMPVLNGN